MISREAFNIRDRAENFYMIGSMGLLTALGLGLAFAVTSVENLGHRGGWQRSHELVRYHSLRPCGRTISFTWCSITRYMSRLGAAHDQLGSRSRRPGGGCGLCTRLAGERSCLPAAGTAGSGDANILTFILVKVTGRAPEGLGRVSLTPEEIKLRFSQVLTRV